MKGDWYEHHFMKMRKPKYCCHIQVMHVKTKSVPVNSALLVFMHRPRTHLKFRLLAKIIGAKRGKN